MKINLNDIVEKKQHVANLQQQVNFIMWDLTKFQGGFHSRINDLLFQLNTTQRHAGQIVQFLNTSNDTYEQLESQLQAKANEFPTDSAWNKEYNQFTHSFNFKNQSKLALDDSLSIGGSVTGTASFSFFHAWTQYKKGHVNASLNANVGYANIAGKCKAVLFQNKQFQPVLDIDIDAKASIANVNGEVGYTTNNFGVSADGALDVGVAKASGKAVISKEELSLKASYGVAAVSGKAHGKISLFGFHLDASVEGEMLALGGGAEFSKGKKYIEIGGKLSLFAGLGFKIRFSYD